MSTKDVFKKSVLEAFTANNGITTDFIIKAIIAMAVAVILGVIIYIIYSNNYNGVVFSRSFAITLIGMTVLTCGLTLAISSNIIISLGMVGALSIVRYRTAIKDPMDLLYLFWSISIGIMVAADLYIVAVLTMVIMFILVYVFSKKNRVGNIYILIAHYTDESAGEGLMKALGKVKYQVKSKTIKAGATEIVIEVYSKDSNTLIADRISSIEGVSDVNMIQYNGEYNG